MEVNRQNRTISEVMKESFLLAGRNSWGIAQVLIIMYIIQAAIIIGITALGSYYMSKGVDVTSIIVIVVVAIIVAIMQALSTAAVLKLVDEKKKGNKFNILNCFAYMGRKFIQLLGATIIMMIVTVILGFLGTILNTFLLYYIDLSGTVFSIFYGMVIAIAGVVLLSFIVPLIVKKDMNCIKAFIEGIKLAFKNGGDVILKLVGFMILTGIIIAIASLANIIPYGGYFITLIISEIALIVFEIGQLTIVEDYNV